MNILDDTNLKKPVLQYPCIWKYKLIVTQNVDVQSIVLSILGERSGELGISKTSKKGLYQSYSLSLEVNSDEDRVGILEKLREHKSIKFIL